MPVRHRGIVAAVHERVWREGPVSCSTADLVAIVVGGPASDRVANEALSSLGGVAGLAGASIEDLAALPGVGAARAARLAASVELGRRAAGAWPSGRWQVRTPGDVAERLVPQMGRLDREELRVILLNTKNVVLASATVYVGNVAGSLVRVGEVFRDAVRRNAPALMVVHNHPSGDPAPSPEDLRVTRELAEAGRLLDVALLDHLIIGHDRWVSLRALGAVPL